MPFFSAILRISRDKVIDKPSKTTHEENGTSVFPTVPTLEMEMDYDWSIVQRSVGYA